MELSITPDGSSHLLALIRNAGASFLAAPCGGTGRCGKCRVRVLEGELPGPSTQEMRFLSEQALKAGWRVSCLVRPTELLVVEVPDESAARSELSDRFRDEDRAAMVSAPAPEVFLQPASLPLPHKDDQRPDWRRLRDTIDDPDLAARPGALATLPGALRSNPADPDFSLTLVRDADRAYGFLAGDAAEYYGVAVDVGTTTLAFYLARLDEGRVIDVVSALNAQKTFGADVISRIQHTMEHKNGLDELKRTIVGQADRIIADMLSRHGIAPERLALLHFTGNTTMMHLLSGMPPFAIAASPFTAVTTDSIVTDGPATGLSCAPCAKVRLLPGISGYVGADIISAVLFSGMHRSTEPTLLIDIGTNGEIVLQTGTQLLCCSTAAGPAFEGAQIRHGVGGVVGAVNTVADSPTISFTTIGDEPAVGICGSGITDTLAILLRAGIVEDTGRMLKAAEFREEGGPAELADRLVEMDGEPAFVVVPAQDTGTGDAIVMTQKDVRELQLAKAAIAAGVATLLSEAGLSADEVTTLYLAGGFGSYLRKQSAVEIGLLPRDLIDRIRVLGNAAGKGAVLGLLSSPMLEEAAGLSHGARYIELSSSPEFQNAYIMEMSFPERQ